MPQAQVLLLDYSESMVATEMDQAHAEMNNLVDATLVSNELGVSIFDTSATSPVPLTNVASEVVKSDIKTTINGIYSAFGTTWVDAGLVEAVQQLDTVSNSLAQRGICMWTDDESIDPYFKTVPIDIGLTTAMSFSNWNGGYLACAAQRRNGHFFAAPSEIAPYRMAGLPLITCLSDMMNTSGSMDYTFPIDYSIYAVKVRIANTFQDTTNLILSVKQPDGTTLADNGTSVVITSYFGGEVVSVMDPPVGIWTATVSCVSGSIDFTLSVQADSVQDVHFDLERIVWPTSVTPRVRLVSSFAAPGLVVRATNAWGEGSSDIQMYDDGLHDDAAANDGIYGGTLTNTLVDGDCWRLSVEATGTSPAFRRLDERSIYITSDPMLETPTNVTASSGTWSNRIDISWDSVTNAEYYDVQRSSDSNIWVNAALVAMTFVPSISDLDVSPGETWYYRVRAIERDFTDSEFSEIETGTTAP